MYDDTAISRSLKKYLAKHRIQQKELAVACNKTEGTISHWVEGRVKVPVNYIPVICEVLDITLYELFDIPDPSLLSEQEKTVISEYRNDEELKLIINRLINKK